MVFSPLEVPTKTLLPRLFQSPFPSLLLVGNRNICEHSKEMGEVGVGVGIGRGNHVVEVRIKTKINDEVEKRLNC